MPYCSAARAESPPPIIEVHPLLAVTAANDSITERVPLENAAISKTPSGL